MNKKLQLLIVLVSLSINSYTQDDGFSRYINFQGVARDASGIIIANQNITVAIALRFDVPTNAISYAEGHTVTTNQNGIFSLQIGSGTTIQGDYRSLTWDLAAFATISINGNELGTTKMHAVPFALNAGNTIFFETNNVIYTDRSTNASFVIGGTQLDNNPNISNDNERLFFNKSKGAFRVGQTSNTQWDDINVGDYSSAMGYNTIASGNSSTAMGYQTTASGDYSTTMGQFTTASGNFSTAMGIETVASGSSSTAMGFQTTASGIGSTAIGGKTTASVTYSTAMGFQTTASGRFSTAMGFDTKAESYSSTAIGSYNIGGGSATSYNGLDPLFEVGNGGSSTTRNNAFTILKNGNIGIAIATPNTKLHITGGTDASLNNGTGYMVLGSLTSQNTVYDENEIMARDNGAAATLYLQKDGGNVNVGAAVVHTSDRRLKKDIETIPYGLQEILKLKPVTYHWKNKSQKHKSLGLIAQEVKPVIKELVSSDNDTNKMLGVSYTELIPVLIKAIQEQQTTIEKLVQRITSLERR